MNWPGVNDYLPSKIENRDLIVAGQLLENPKPRSQGAHELAFLWCCFIQLFLAGDLSTRVDPLSYFSFQPVRHS